MFAASSKGMRRAYIIAIVIVVVALGVAISAHISMAKSDAFIAAESFLRSSNEMERLVGSVREISISNVGESFINETGNDGRAKLSLTISGELASADAEVNLTSKLRVWRVTSADIRVVKEAKIVSLPIKEAAH